MGNLGIRKEFFITKRNIRRTKKKFFLNQKSPDKPCKQMNLMNILSLQGTKDEENPRNFYSSSEDNEQACYIAFNEGKQSHVQTYMQAHCISNKLFYLQRNKHADINKFHINNVETQRIDIYKK